MISMQKKIGRWLLAKWYDFNPEQWSPATHGSAVLFSPESIGDGMAAIPILRALQKRGFAWIGIVASSRSAPIFSCFTSENIQVFDVPSDRNYSQIKQIARNIRGQYGTIDLCIDASCATSSSTYFVGTLKARNNLQRIPPRMKAFNNVISPQTLEKFALTPTVQWWANVMSEVGISDVEGKYELPIAEAIDYEVGQWCKKLGPFVLFNLEGGAPYRTVSYEKARQLVEVARQTTNLPIVLPYDNFGREKAKRLVLEVENVYSLSNQTSILETAALIKRANLVISPDTSVIHIASAYDRPTLGLYITSFENNVKWRPLSTKCKVIYVAKDLNSHFLDLKTFRIALTELMVM